MESNQVIRLFESPATQLRCKHALTGLAPAVKMCAHWYECTTCEYDQMLEDTAVAAESHPQTAMELRIAS